MKAQDIKNSIFQMAMEGKLVPQDHNDEPASVLLERINEEKQQLIKDKKIKRNNKESVIFRKNNHFYEKVGKNGEEVCIDDEIPWDIPDSWEWCKLGNLISIITGISYKKGDVTSDGLRVLRGGNIQDTNVLLLDDDVYLPESYYDSIKEIRKGDILIVASTGSKKVIGKPGFVNENYKNVFIGAFLRICRPIINYLSEYVQLIFASEYYRNHIRTLSQGTNINNVKKEYLENLFVPLPPLKEQKMILTKINQLLPLIDDYGRNQEELETLNNNFPNKIKDSILQDAIQGKLGPQDANDEPASVLLERIKENKEKLIKEKKIKRNNKESFIYRKDNHFYEKVGKTGGEVCIDEELPFDVPDSWEICRLNVVNNIYTGNSINKTEKESKFMGLSEGYNYIATKDVDFDNEIDYENGVKIPKDLEKFRIAKSGSVLLCIEGGSAGRKIALTNEDVCFGNKLCCFTSYGIDNKFLYYYLQSPIFKEVFKSEKTGIIGGVSIGKIRDFFVPVPPLKEQKRIVAKIEELFFNINFMKTDK